MVKRALVVGVDDYSVLDPSGNSDLGLCVGDAKAWYETLRDAFGFTDLYYLADLDASRTNILAALRHLIDISQAGDALCFYFSGHGSRIRSTTAGDADLYYEALVPAAGAYITDRDLYDLTDPLYPDAVNFTVITDSCHSGGLHPADAAVKSPVFMMELLDAIASFLKTLIPCGVCVTPESNAFANNVSNARVTDRGVIDLDVDPDRTLVASTKATLLSGCRFDELSYLDYELGRSFLTAALLDLVNQSNFEADHFGVVEHLQAKVAEYVDRYKPGPGASQTPQLFGQRNRMEENFLGTWDHTPLEL